MLYDIQGTASGLRLTKHNLIDILLKKYIHHSSNIPKILSVGCGTGDDLAIIKKYGEIYVIDVDKNALLLIDDTICQKKILGDACSMPFIDGYFDYIVCFDVLEHIQEDGLAIKEIYRTLKKGGILLIIVPAFQSIYSSHDKKLDHYRRYSMKGIRRLTNMFDKKNFFYWNSLLFPLVALSRIIKKNASPKVDTMNYNPVLSALLTFVMKFDNFLIKRSLSMPFGLSIVGICKK
ncbi:MAG: class I SAM-dependent methyltransferase [candidate division SR1 bacterium]|nr:class I SAM-dependent methyltransferase [candidate division SR1 bacterium]